MKVTADDVAQLLASPPPRKVPAHLRRAMQGGTKGWAMLLAFGAIFGGMGLGFTWIFFPWRFLDDWRVARSPHAVPGVVRSVAETNLSENETRVMEYVFTASLPNGRRLHGSCYTTGRRWSEGAAVTVRYLEARPEMACIEGARLSLGSASGAFVVIFPLAGGSLLAWALVSRVRTNRLMEHGQVAEVDIRSIDATTMQVNYQTLYKITLSSLPLTNQPVVVKRWAKPEINFLTQRALDKQPVFVLYDPRRPRSLVFPEALIEA